MGSVRRGLIIGLAPTMAMAEVCDKEPSYGPVGSYADMLSDALHLFQFPIGIFAAVVFILALTLRKVLALWASCAVSVFLLLALLINPAFPDPSGMRYFSVIEGCAAPQNLSVLLLLIFAGFTAYLARRIPQSERAIQNS